MTPKNARVKIDDTFVHQKEETGPDFSMKDGSRSYHFPLFFTNSKTQGANKPNPEEP